MSKSIAEQQMTVYIAGAAAKLTKRVYYAKDMADVFAIDTSVIADFREHATIEKVVEGPPDMQGKWDLCSVMIAFAPRMYSKPAHAKRALAQTANEVYPSRMELQIPRHNVS